MHEPPKPEHPSVSPRRSQTRRWPVAILLFVGVILGALVNGGFQFYSQSSPSFNDSVDNRIKPATPHDLWSPLESGPIAFRSWNGRQTGAGDTDLIFKWDNVFLVEYSEGTHAYVGTYRINNAGEITFRFPEFEEEFKTTWPVMLLQRHGGRLRLVPKDPGNDFVTKKRSGVQDQSGQADYWPFREISPVICKKLLAEVEQLERRNKEKNKSKASEARTTTSDPEPAAAPVE